MMQFLFHPTCVCVCETLGLYGKCFFKAMVVAQILSHFPVLSLNKCCLISKKAKNRSAESKLFLAKCVCWRACVCVCVCVCEKERERERERGCATMRPEIRDRRCLHSRPHNVTRHSENKTHTRV